MSAPQPKLREPRAFAHQHRKCLRRNLGIKRPVIARLDAVEAARVVGDDAREHVEPAGRAFRIGGCCDILRQREAFEQRHDIDRAGLQHRAVGQRDLVQLQVLDALRDRGVAGQEARAHAIRDVAEAQVKACGLDLVGREFDGGQNPTRFRQRGDHAIRQDAPLGHERIATGWLS